MTRFDLNSDQRRIVDIIEALGFGVIERLFIRDGSPCFQPEPRVLQTIKLHLEPERHTHRNCSDRSLKQEFESLFDQMSALGDAVVEIEIRHGLPFKLVLERRCTELV